MVGKSTVPVGSAARLAARLAELAPAGDGAELAWNPEFLREGFAVEDTLHPDRLVVGVAQRRAPRRCCARCTPRRSPRASPFVVTDFPTAELVKTAANSFLATKISFINAMAEVCEAAGADVVKLAEAHRPRRADRPQVPAAPASASAAAACPRTSAPSWPGPASWAPTRR